jgi:3-deoxy-D-manno-octulosonate 8-phosphate phosphatase (KDO 8-P phosphatase)
MIKKIKLLILDIDGVMTDGTKVYGLDGLTIGKRYCDRDFTAIKQFKASGVQVCFLSGDDKVNQAMAMNRKTDFYYSRGKKKTDFIAGFIEKYNCELEEMAYVGDDVFDIPIMEIVGYSFCPSDVTNQVKDASTFVIGAKSGDNVVSKLYEYLVNVKLVDTCTLSQIDELDKLETF